jgi:hypothetical protein
MPLDPRLEGVSKLSDDPVPRLFQQLGDLKRRIEILERRAILAAEAWNVIGAAGQPAFTNGWVNFGGTDATAAFYKDAAGVVHLRGIVKNGVVAASMFTLPVGYRHDAGGGGMRFPIVSNAAFGEIDIHSDGTTFLIVGSNAWVDLSSISFRAA